MKDIPIDKPTTTPYTNINWERASILFKQKYSSTKYTRILPSTSDILHILASVGTIGISFAAPQAGKAFAQLLLREKPYKNWQIRQPLRQLQKQKFVTIQEDQNGTTTVRITKNGYSKALTYALNSIHLTNMEKWDKKWRVVIFDIPEKHKRLRNIFRMRLKQLGLFNLQKSVFISPYKCFDEIEFLRELYSVSFEVRYLIAEKVEDDEFLRLHFNLPSS